MIPKGFFPDQDTGIIIGTTDAAQDISFDAMATLQQQVNSIVQADPAVASVVASVGAGVAGQTANNGRMYITLKPWDQRKDNAYPGDRAGIDRKMQAVPGIRLFLQAGAGCARGRTRLAHAVSIHLAGRQGRTN